MTAIYIAGCFFAFGIVTPTAEFDREQKGEKLFVTLFIIACVTLMSWAGAGLVISAMFIELRKQRES